MINSPHPYQTLTPYTRALHSQSVNHSTDGTLRDLTRRLRWNSGLVVLEAGEAGVEDIGLQDGSCRECITAS